MSNMIPTGYICERNSRVSLGLCLDRMRDLERMSDLPQGRATLSATVSRYNGRCVQCASAERRGVYSRTAFLAYQYGLMLAVGTEMVTATVNLARTSHSASRRKPQRIERTSLETFRPCRFLLLSPVKGLWPGFGVRLFCTLSLRGNHSMQNGCTLSHA